MNNLNLLNSESSMLLYQAEDGHTRIKVQFKGETVWLSLNQMADLFQRDKSVISRHIRNVFDEGELTQDVTVAKYATVQTEGSRSITPIIILLAVAFDGCALNSSHPPVFFSIQYDSSLSRNNLALIIPSMNQTCSDAWYDSIAAFYNYNGITPLYVNINWKAVGISDRSYLTAIQGIVQGIVK